uniref:Polysaccharide biosynthesis protein n=1 Tax=Candidatus Caldatribacterium saccharofermentans TaxID=1454753 RepID=A0A7V4TGJ9_9BACT
MRVFWSKFILDVIAWTVTIPLAFFLRLEGIPLRYLPGMIAYFVLSTPLKAFLIWAFGLPRQYWSRAGVRDLLMVIRCTVLGAAGIFLLTVYVLLPHTYSVPRSIPVIDALLATFLLGGMRFGARLLHERLRAGKVRGKKRVLVVGAGEAGTTIVREMLRHPEAGLVPVGFLDDDKAKQRHTLVGVPVLGGLDELSQVVHENRIDEVLIAIPSAPGEVVRKVVELARNSGVHCRIIPGIYEILSGKVSIARIRDVSLEDLLRREPVRLNLEEVKNYLKDRTVLVTGAGGSIGREIVFQVARFSPKEILLLGHGENSLFETETELKLRCPDVQYHIILGDIRDYPRLQHVFCQYRPQVVFHAAAHKHVPLAELNPSEAVFNNVLGTKNLVDLALEYEVERFVNISTDKAVNPVSVMGATKRVAEYLVQQAAQKARPGQIFVSVRFGNVLGSRGSVVPLFQKLIQQGKPIPVTHPDMRRYFMTIPEAVQLVLQAAGLGENGVVYVLDMGEPVRIVDLARDLIRLSGFEPDRDIQIEYVGIRPGEKLFEEILSAEEGVVASRHEKIFIARTPVPSDEELERGIAQLLAAAQSYDGDSIRQALRALVPTYRPDGTSARESEREGV